MKCCPECFKDQKARGLVSSFAVEDAGICDLCGRSGGRLLPVEPESDLSDPLQAMLGVFSKGDCGGGTLYDVFCETWDLFQGVTEEAFLKFLEALFPEDERIGGLMSGPVRLDPSPDLDNPFALSFFGGRDWNEFSETIKHENRYMAKIENKDVLKSLFCALAREVEPDQGTWFRARLWNGGSVEDIKEEKLKEAPRDKAVEGRMSPRGISCLYISDSVEGAMAEIRASRHDEVAVMEMRPKEPLRILDLSRIDEISPFDENVDCGSLASNKVNLLQMKDALTKPMRSTDDKIEYVPTQFIAEFARLAEFDGIGYNSVLHEKDGRPSYNIASFVLFDDAFERVSMRLYRVSKSDLTAELAYEA